MNMNEQADLLCEVIDALGLKSTNGVFLNEIAFEMQDGTPVPLREVEVNQKVTDRCRQVVRLTDRHLYLSMEYDFPNDKDLLGMQFMYEQYINKFTEAIKTGRTTTYEFFVQSFAVKNGMAYKIEARNPIFCYRIDSTLQFVFDIKDFHFGKTEANFSDIDREVEMEKRQEMEEYEQYAEDGAVSEDE